MDREQRILNYNKRDATMIVSSKPSPSEGNNGDLAAGNTAQGPMLFSKVNNKWYSIKPRKVPARQDVTFKESFHIIPSRVKRYSTISYDNVSWLVLGASPSAGDGDDYDNNFHKSNSSVGLWNDQSRIPILLPYDTTIKGFFGRGVKFASGTTFEAINYTVETLSLKDGETDWDTDSGSNFIQTGGAASSSIERVTVNFLEESKMYKFDMNDSHIYPKGSFLAMHITALKQDGSRADFLDAYFELQLEFHA